MLLPQLSDLSKSRLSGPWEIKTEHKTMIHEITNDINLIPLTNMVALDNLGSTFYPGTITFTRPTPGTGGHADYFGNIVANIDSPAYYLKRTLAHEMAHRSMMILNGYRSAAPYTENQLISYFNDIKAKDNFEDAMMQSLKNLHQEFIPDKPVPEELKQITSNIKSIIPYLHPKEREITESFIGMFHTDLYQNSDYHTEFVVRLPEAIARFGDIPPYLIDTFKPLTNFYKTDITPKMMNYIENHSYKGNLIPTDIDKYHPETYLSRSGEDELLARAATNTLKGNEAKLVKQMKEIKNFVKTGDTQAAILSLDAITDERVIRFTLSQAIENNNQALFAATLPKIQAPQYLGPQLVRATENNCPEMALALMPAVENQYYLTKTLETSLAKEIPEIFYPSYAKVKDEWLLRRTKLKFANNDLVKTAKASKQDFETAISQSSATILANIQNQPILEQTSSKAEQPSSRMEFSLPSTQMYSSITNDPSLLSGLRMIEQHPSTVRTISSPSSSAVPVAANIALAAVTVGAAVMGAKAVYNYFYPPETLSEKEQQWFMLVSKKDNMENIKEFLIQNKDFDLNARNLDGKTALHLLAEKNRKKTIEFLIEKGADINIQDKDGNSPLHFAAQKEYPNLVKLLLSNSANVDIVNKAGHTAKDLARSDFMQVILVSQNAVREAKTEIDRLKGSLSTPKTQSQLVRPKARNLPNIMEF